MVRAKKDKIIVEDQIEETEEFMPQEDVSPELLELRAKVAALEAEKKDREEGDESTYMREIELLRRKSKTGLNEIKYKEIAPEMISLWHVSGHNVGKRVGPVMLEQGEETFLRFRVAGIRLSAKRPTEEWIAKYKETPEYQKAAAAEIKRRSGKDKSRKESEVDKLSNAISKLSGIPVDKMNTLVSDPSLVKTRNVDLLASTPKA